MMTGMGLDWAVTQGSGHNAQQTVMVVTVLTPGPCSAKWHAGPVCLPVGVCLWVRIDSRWASRSDLGNDGPVLDRKGMPRGKTDTCFAVGNGMIASDSP